MSPIQILRSLLLCLWLPVALGAQDMSNQHDTLLTQQIAKIEKSRTDVPELFMLAAGLSSKQDVFRNDVQSMRDLFDKHWNTQSRSIALIADEGTKESTAYPTRANLRRAASAVGKKMNPQKDVFLLFLTSHGSRSGLEATVPGDSGFTFSAVDARKLLEDSGAKYRIVIISACHAGTLISELADENTMVIAAAHATRTSFGCSFADLHTWFTQALFEALISKPQFEAAFHITVKSIEAREQGGEAWEQSLPQLHVGSAIATKLAAIERRATDASLWTPPVLATDEGKVRQLMGDYLAITKVDGMDTQVRWLQLKKVGVPNNGIFPISAWAQHFYKNQGEFEALYDPKKKLLTGNRVGWGSVELSLDGKSWVDKRTPSGLAFEKVLRREVFEARGSYPPSRMRARAPSVIRLLYLSAKDCPYCQIWERDHLESGRLAGMPEFKHIDFVTAKRQSVKYRLRKGDLPDNLSYLYDKIDGDKSYASLLTVLPAFVVTVDDQIRVWSTGTFLDSPIYPVLRAAVREKTEIGN